MQEAKNFKFIEEPAPIDEEVFEKIMDKIDTYKGKKIIMHSTPLGNNWLYKKWMEAKEDTADKHYKTYILGEWVEPIS